MKFLIIPINVFHIAFVSLAFMLDVATYDKQYPL